MKKKVFVFAGVLCMTAMFMVGCGSQTPAANQEASEPNAQTQSSSVQSETVPESTAPQTEFAEEVAPQTVQSTSENAEAAAKAAALKDAGVDEKDVLAISIHKEYDDGRMLYEGEIIYGNTDYDFEIDAQTGDILEWSEGKL